MPILHKFGLAQQAQQSASADLGGARQGSSHVLRHPSETSLFLVIWGHSRCLPLRRRGRGDALQASDCGRDVKNAKQNQRQRRRA